MTCAVIFRIHFWDAFAERQLRRLRDQTQHGDVFVLFDTTNSPAPTHLDVPVVEVDEKGTLALGLPQAGRIESGLFWYNGDYPLYYFYNRYPDYHLYLQFEYDFLLSVSVDQILNEMCFHKLDFLSTRSLGQVSRWDHLDSCLPFYKLSTIKNELVCACALSNRALHHLRNRRIAMAASVASSDHWPIWEGFLPTELSLSGFRCSTLANYFDTTFCTWWPPMLEEDAIVQKAPFAHPVLDRRRYGHSVVKGSHGIRQILWPKSAMYRKLLRLSSTELISVLLHGIWRKSLKRFRRASLFSSEAHIIRRSP